jgi:hypothetical protein
MRSRHRIFLMGTLLAAAVAVGACGLTDPYAGHPRSAPKPRSTNAAALTASTRVIADADPAPEQNGTTPAAARSAQQRLTVVAARLTPQAAIARYARLYINWSAATIAQTQRRLAAISLASARAQALQAAARYARDSTLAASHVVNSGSIVSIAPGESNARGDWVVVTREQTTGSGDYSALPASLHITYAQVAHHAAGWVITQWSPQD